MVCNTRKPNETKLEFAIANGIPSVHTTWLWESIRSGCVQPYEAYTLLPAAQPQKPKPKPRASLPDVPTARLSEDGNLETRAKNDNAAAPKSRRGHPRLGALGLSLSGPPTPASATESSNANNKDSNGDKNGQLHVTYDGAESLPLQDINPSVNSPRRQSTTSTNSTHHTEESDAPTKPAPAPRPRQTRGTKQSSPNSFEPPAHAVAPPVADKQPKPQETNYTDIMSKLLANRKTSTPEENSGRRKRRPLGRAQSTRSNASTVDDLFSKPNTMEDDDSADAAVTEQSPGEAEPEPFELTQASQLGWDDSPGAQRKRESLIRSLGGKVKENKKIVEVAGVVKDRALVDSINTRERASRRRKG